MSSSMMSTLLVVGVLVGGAIIVMKRCEPPFDQIGLCEALAGVTGGGDAGVTGDATEETSSDNIAPNQVWGDGCCKCRYNGNDFKDVECQRNGGDWKDTKGKDVSEALANCKKKCKGRGTNPNVSQKQASDKAVAAMKTPAAQAQIKMWNAGPRRKYVPGKGLVAYNSRSYFADTYNIRPYTSYRGRMSV